MWFCKTEKKHLIDALSGRFNVLEYSVSSNEKYYSNLYDDQIALCWGDDPKKNHNRPFTIIIPNGNSTDFLAWTQTYLQDYRPITTFHRVIEEDIFFNYFLNNNIDINQDLSNSAIAIIISEAYTLASNLPKIDLLSMVACKSTLSYCLSQAFFSFQDTGLYYELAQRWVNIRSKNGQKSFSSSIDILVLIFEILHSLKNNTLSKHTSYNMNFSSFTTTTKNEAHRSILFKAALNLHQSFNGVIDDDILYDISSGNKTIANINFLTKETREARIRFTRTFFSENHLDDCANDIFASFLGGYVLYLIAPGSISFYDVASEAQAKYKFIFLFYGMFAGLYKKNEILSGYNSLGRYIYRCCRDQGSVTDFPQADISFDEYMLISNNTSLENLRRGSATFASVEIFPTVTALVGIKTNPNEANLTKSSDNFSAEKLIFINQNINRIHALLYEMQSALTPNDLLHSKTSSPKKNKKNTSTSSLKK
ncbi:hypothetical protein [Solidesulfovibrio sp. C21]|uniref:hypothetical protein n=1 Tax=Solidesulfovibrio sp. C21 TaxID=3398613 RepID=UPI0039FBD856